jgi:hypothetical protein
VTDPGTVGTVTGKVGTVTGNVGTVTGKVGTVTGNVGTVTGKVGTVTGNVGTVTGNVGTVTGKVGTVTGNVGTVTGRVVTVTGNVDNGRVGTVTPGISWRSAADAGAVVTAPMAITAARVPRPTSLVVAATPFSPITLDRLLCMRIALHLLRPAADLLIGRRARAVDERNDLLASPSSRTPHSRGDPDRRGAHASERQRR